MDCRPDVTRQKPAGEKYLQRECRKATTFLISRPLAYRCRQIVLSCVQLVLMRSVSYQFEASSHARRFIIGNNFASHDGITAFSSPALPLHFLIPAASGWTLKPAPEEWL